MKRGWIAGAGILLLLFGSAEVIYHLHGNEVAVQIAIVCIILVTMFAIFRVAKWADNAPARPEDELKNIFTIPAPSTVSPNDGPEPKDLIEELRALGYGVRRDDARWVVTDPSGRISFYFSSNEALRNDADSLRKRVRA